MSTLILQLFMDSCICIQETVYSVVLFGYVRTYQYSSRLFLKSFPFFQMLIIVFGFIVSAMIIEESVFEWSNSPVITSLDSIAAPIENIQYPTVTVCRREYKAPDIWAMLEIVLNTIDINNQDVRKDFDYLFFKVAESFKSWLISTKSSHLKETILKPTANLDYESKQIAHLVANGTLSYNDLKKIMKASVGATFYPHIIKLMDEFGFNILEYDYETNDNQNGFLWDNYNEDDLSSKTDSRFGDDICNSSYCQKILNGGFNIEATVIAMDNMMGVKPYGLYFGSFLATLLPSLDLMSFKLDDLNSLHNTRCLKLKDVENQFHAIFSDLSKSLGFNESEAISIFDIPSMMAFVKYSDLLYETKYNQAFFHSRCKIHANSYFREDTRSCLALWTAYLNPSMSKNIFILQK